MISFSSRRNIITLPVLLSIKKNAVLPSWTMEDGKITELKLYPIDLGMKLPRSQKGVPVLNGSEETLRYLQDMCKPFGTEMDIADGVATVRL